MTSLPTAPSLAKNDDNLVWIDCEMTGLDPGIDKLLEIADQLDSLEGEPSDALEASYRAWGRFRAPTHRLVWQALSAEQG